MDKQIEMQPMNFNIDSLSLNKLDVNLWNID